MHYIGPVGSFMTYIKCGQTSCDVYYCEILLGRLYVGFLYTINQNQEVVDFCPIAIATSSESDYLYLTSNCEGANVRIFATKFSYISG